MTKAQAVEEWLIDVDMGILDSKIVRGLNGEYFVTRGDMLFMGDNLVYSWARFVNSDANLDVADIIKRF